MFCAAAVWLRPHIELIVGAKVWAWGATPTGSCISRRAGAVFLHLFHACQVPWVKLGAEHNITKAGFHGSELWSLTLLPSGSWWSASQRSDIDNLLGNQANEKTFFWVCGWSCKSLSYKQADVLLNRKKTICLSQQWPQSTIYSIKMGNQSTYLWLKLWLTYKTFQIVKMDLHILYL